MIINAIDRNLNFLSDEKTESSLLYKPLSNFAPTIFPYLNFEKIREDIEEFRKDEEIVI